MKISKVFILFTILFFSCKKEKPVIDKLELPQNSKNELIEYSAFTLSYNENHEQAEWVAYELTKEEALSDLFQRTDNFRLDPNISSGSAELSDYENSGYDRGHLIPAGDNKWSETAMSESFYLSNISPQTAKFNRGVWVSLEKQVRDWAEKYNGVYVTVGGVLTAGLSTIGDNKVSVPEYFFKVILDYNGEKAIGFIIPNTDIEDSFKNYAVSIDSVEIFTGLDFFYKLPDNMENELEERLNFSAWDFTYY